MIRKKKSTFPKMKIPGEIFMKHVQYGLPTVSGIYACYYKYDPPDSWSHNFPPAGMKIINFSEGKFFGNHQVLAWIGPLPSLSLDELADNNECLSRVFYISDLKGAAKREWYSGPHSQYIQAFLSPGKKNHFIFEINTHKTIPNPFAKFNTDKLEWVELKEKEVKKYIKMIKMFRRK